MHLVSYFVFFFLLPLSLASRETAGLLADPVVEPRERKRNAWVGGGQGKERQRRKVERQAKPQMDVLLKPGCVF